MSEPSFLGNFYSMWMLSNYHFMIKILPANSWTDFAMVREDQEMLVLTGNLDADL
jgi:hypothetical protein